MPPRLRQEPPLPDPYFGMVFFSPADASHLQLKGGNLRIVIPSPIPCVPGGGLLPSQARDRGLLEWVFLCVTGDRYG
jgi:hypothetical protein